MKKIILIGLILLTVVGLSGCGGSKNIGGNNGKQNLTYYVWGNNNEVAAIQGIIDDFEALNPEISINIERAGSDYFGDLQLKFASGNGPDIFLMDPGEIRPFLEEDFLLSLDKYIDDSEVLEESDLWQINDGYRYDGTEMGQGDLYAFVKDWSPDFMLVYNKNYVSEYRENHPDAFPYLSEDEPMTWTQYLEFSTALQVGSGSNITRYGSAMDFVPYKHLLEFIQMSGSSMFTNDDKLFNRDDQNVINAFQYFIDLQEGPNAPAPYLGGSSIAASGEMFTNGNVASLFMGRWGFLAYDWYDIDFEIGILPPPVPDNMSTTDGVRDKYAGVSGMIANCINRDTKYPDAAYKFLEYYQTEGMKKLASIGFNIPGNKTVANDIFLSVEDESILEVNTIYLDAANNYAHPIEYNKYVSTTTIERKISEKVSLYFEKREGITSLETLLDAIEESLNKEIRNAQ